MRTIKIVTIGGGTGQYNLLRGLKKCENVHLTALVSMVDDGGCSGLLRDEKGVLPPGDLRRGLIALSEDPEKIREMIEYRSGDRCLGNFIIAFFEQKYGRENYIQKST